MLWVVVEQKEDPHPKVSINSVCNEFLLRPSFFFYGILFVMLCLPMASGLLRREWALIE